MILTFISVVESVPEVIKHYPNISILINANTQNDLIQYTHNMWLEFCFSVYDQWVIITDGYSHVCRK